MSDVAGLIVGDIGLEEKYRDIIIETQIGQLQRINELHPSYLPLQYPILSPYGENGYKRDILLSGTKEKKKLSFCENIFASNYNKEMMKQ